MGKYAEVYIEEDEIWHTVRIIVHLKSGLVNIAVSEQNLAFNLEKVIDEVVEPLVGSLKEEVTKQLVTHYNNKKLAKKEYGNLLLSKSYFNYAQMSHKIPKVSLGTEFTKMIEQYLPQDILFPCPSEVSTCVIPRNVMHMVIHLNDHHKWTYEKIADWLDGLKLDITVPLKEEESGENDSGGNPTGLASGSSSGESKDFPF